MASGSPQWWMLLVAILSILRGQGSLVVMERFAKRHRHTLNELLDANFGKLPSDSTFRVLLAQLDVEGFESLLRDWMAAKAATSALCPVSTTNTFLNGTDMINY